VTARARRRRKRTIATLVSTVLLLIAAFAVVAVGALTLLDSEEGEAVAVDEREVITLPDTPNAMLAVSDDAGRLTSLVVATLDPTGEGGSIVTVPVNADANAGLATEVVPLRSVFDPDDVQPLRLALEGMLAITLERADTVGAAELADLVEPLTPVDVQLPENVVDSDSDGRGVVARKGDRTLRAVVAGDVLAAHNRAGKSYNHHDVDVEVWSALADEAPALEPRDDPEVPPETTLELFADLWRGEVDVRDLAISVAVADPDGPNIDSVIVDRRDALLVFAQVSPSLVSKPNQALSFRLVSRFNDEQLDASDGLFESNAEVARRFIGELLFFQGNLVSADTNAAVEGAEEVTLVEVADARFVDDLEELADATFGASEVVEATRLIDGVDVVVTLGESFIERKVVGDLAALGSSTEDAGEPADDTDESEPVDDADATDDTVATDE